MYFSTANVRAAAGPGCGRARPSAWGGLGRIQTPSPLLSPPQPGSPGRPQPRALPLRPPGGRGERPLSSCLVKLVMYHVNYQCDLKMVAGPRKINGNPNSNYVAGVKELN